MTQSYVAVEPSALNTKTTSTNNNLKTEIIVIDGLRRSLLTALDIKKQSVAILDAVVSVDIGKLPEYTLCTIGKINRNQKQAGQCCFSEYCYFPEHKGGGFSPSY